MSGDAERAIARCASLLPPPLALGLEAFDGWTPREKLVNVTRAILASICGRACSYFRHLATRRALVDGGFHKSRKMPCSCGVMQPKQIGFNPISGRTLQHFLHHKHPHRLQIIPPLFPRIKAPQSQFGTIREPCLLNSKLSRFINSFPPPHFPRLGRDQKDDRPRQQRDAGHKQEGEKLADHLVTNTVRPPLVDTMTFERS